MQKSLLKLPTGNKNNLILCNCIIINLSKLKSKLKKMAKYLKKFPNIDVSQKLVNDCIKFRSIRNHLQHNYQSKPKQILSTNILPAAFIPNYFWCWNQQWFLEIHRYNVYWFFRRRFVLLVPRWCKLYRQLYLQYSNRNITNHTQYFGSLL